MKAAWLSKWRGGNNNNRQHVIAAIMAALSGNKYLVAA